MTTKSEGYRFQGVLVVTWLEQISESVGYEWQLIVAVAQQNRIDVEIDGVLLDSAYADDL